MFALVATFGLLAAGCDALSGKDADSGAPSPLQAEVKAEAVGGGVKLSWPVVIGAEGFAVYRKTGDTPLKLLSSSPGIDGVTGQYVYYDVISAANELVAEKDYTYTVVTTPTAATGAISQTVVTSKTGAIPAKGSKLASPGGVTLTLTPNDSGNGTIEVTWGAVEGAGTYRASLSLDGAPLFSGTTTGTGIIYDAWSPYVQIAGTYAASVAALSDGGYYAESDAGVKAVKYEAPVALLGSVSVSSARTTTPAAPEGGAQYAITGYTVTISLFGTVTGAAYQVYRVAPDGTERPVEGTVTPNFLGNGSLTDTITTLPVKTAEAYHYRIEASKDGKTRNETTGMVIIPALRSATTLTGIAVDVATGAEKTRTFSMTPSRLDCTNALQAGDKLVIYAATAPLYTPNASDPTTYVEALSFSKDELAAVLVVAKPTAAITYDAAKSVYIQAWLVYADGTRKPYSAALTGNGVGGTGSYSADSGSVRWARLQW
jgi:hypothetical protein